jgi:hypothetical protein
MDCLDFSFSSLIFHCYPHLSSLISQLDNPPPLRYNDR